MTTSQNAEAEGHVPEFHTGDRMAKALDHAGLSRTAMADYMGVSTETLRRWTNGRTPVRKGVLRLWALATGVDLEWLETGRARRDSNPQPSDWEPDTVVVPFPRPPADRKGWVYAVLTNSAGVA